MSTPDGTPVARLTDYGISTIDQNGEPIELDHAQAVELADWLLEHRPQLDERRQREKVSDDLHSVATYLGTCELPQPRYVYISHNQIDVELRTAEDTAAWVAAFNAQPEGDHTLVGGARYRVRSILLVGPRASVTA